MPHTKSSISMENIGKHPLLHDRAYEMLRAAILSGEFNPGERLVESDLAGRLGISRSPVREAIRRLQQDGLVEVRARSGIFVATIPLGEVDAFYRMRAALEGAAASLAAERASTEDLAHLAVLLERAERAVDAEDYPLVVLIADEFHRAIHAAARSERLFALLSQIYGQVMHYRNRTLRMPGRAPDALRGHAVILEPLKAGNAKAAQKAMYDHVDGARIALLREIKKQGADGVGLLWD